MIMKKFYIPIFTAVLLAVSFLSQGQVYNSITTNPNGWTLDDPRFWGATTPAEIIDKTIPPQNPCNGCTINIRANVIIVPYNGGSPANGGVGTTSQVLGANDPSLSDLVVNGGSINVIGNTSVTVNTYVELNGVVLLLGSNATDIGSFFVNDEIVMDEASSVRIANPFGYIDANNTGTKTNMFGPLDNFSTSDPQPGIYGLLSTPLGGANYSQVLSSLGNGSLAGGFAFYGAAPPFTPFNCTTPAAPGGCNFGLVNGPATTNLNSTYGIVFGVTPTLPVQLVQFLADKNDDGSVKLSWSTAQEQNANDFEIERSGDQAKWTTLGSVKAKGYSSTTTSYSFTDKEPIDGKGYYRLKMVDLDQKFKYSPTVSVSSTSTNQALIIYNNPYSDMIRTRVHVSRAQNLVLTVSDMVGRTYINQNYPAQAGNNYINLQPNVGSSGMYILRIHGDSYDQTVKIEKQ
jgi:hypothetical protein